jgi:hypothetical protein
MYDHLKINSTIYAVHKNHAGKKLTGGKIQVCKVKTFYNLKGKIIPLLKVIGTTAEVDPSTHKIYVDLPKAIDAIRS